MMKGTGNRNHRKEEITVWACLLLIGGLLAGPAAGDADDGLRLQVRRLVRQLDDLQRLEGTFMNANAAASAQLL